MVSIKSIQGVLYSILPCAKESTEVNVVSVTNYYIIVTTNSPSAVLALGFKCNQVYL